MKRKKRGKLKRGKKSVRAKTSRPSPKRKTTRPPQRRSSLGRYRSSGTKTVGRHGEFRLTFKRFNTKISFKELGSPEFKQDLLNEVKAFRVKHNTKRTRTIATIKLKRRGKTRLQKISIGRAEFGDAKQRVEDTLIHFQRLIKNYMREGFTFGGITQLELGRVVKTKTKKKLKKKKR